MKITFYSTIGFRKKLVLDVASGSQWGELHSTLAEAGYATDNMKGICVPSELSLESPDAEIPEGTSKIFLSQMKSSGAMPEYTYLEAVRQINILKDHSELGADAVDFFGNIVGKTTDDLNELIEDFMKEYIQDFENIDDEEEEKNLDGLVQSIDGYWKKLKSILLDRSTKLGGSLGSSQQSLAELRQLDEEFKAIMRKMK